MTQNVLEHAKAGRLLPTQVSAHTAPLTRPLCPVEAMPRPLPAPDTASFPRTGSRPPGPQGSLRLRGRGNEQTSHARSPRGRQAPPSGPQLCFAQVHEHLPSNASARRASAPPGSPGTAQGDPHNPRPFGPCARGHQEPEASRPAFLRPVGGPGLQRSTSAPGTPWPLGRQSPPAPGGHPRPSVGPATVGPRAGAPDGSVLTNASHQIQSKTGE